MRDTLHWLSYPQRIIFKLCLLTYKCLHGLAPPYLSQYCQPLSAHSGRSQLRSAEVRQLFVPRIRTTVMGSRGFYYVLLRHRGMTYHLCSVTPIWHLLILDWSWKLLCFSDWFGTLLRAPSRQTSVIWRVRNVCLLLLLLHKERDAEEYSVLS